MSNPSDASRHLKSSIASFNGQNYLACQKSAESAVALYTQDKDPLGIALARTWIGAAMTQQSSYQSGLEQLRSSLESLKRLGRMDQAGNALNYTAIIYEELGDFETAFKKYEMALEIARETKDRPLESKILANYGEGMLNAGHLKKSLAPLQQALCISKTLEDHDLTAWCYLALAKTYQGLDSMQHAEENFELARKTAFLHGCARTKAEVLTGFGSFLIDRGRCERAVVALKSALEFASESKVIREIFKTNLALSKAYEATGNPVEALSAFKIYHEIHTETYRELARTKINSLTAEMQLKQVNLHNQIAHLKNVELKNAVEKLKIQSKELEELSIRDSLTGLHNRRWIDRRLCEAFEHSRRFNTTISVAILDADHFKKVNDQMGHSIGDKTLVALGNLLTASLRKTDFVGRYGGEEFLLVLPGSGEKMAKGICEKIREKIQSFSWSNIHGNLSVTVSIGVVEANGRASWEEAVTLADQCLYKAKLEGRNRVCSADDLNTPNN